MNDNNVNPEHNETPQQFQQQGAFHPQQQFQAPKPDNGNKKIIAIVVTVAAATISLLVVLGIVAAIAIPSLMNQRESSVDAAMQSYAIEIAKNIEKEALTLKDKELESEVPQSFAKLDTNVSEEISIEVEGTFQNYGVAVYVEDSRYEYDMRGYIYYSREGGLAPISALDGTVDRQKHPDH